MIHIQDIVTLGVAVGAGMVAALTLLAVVSSSVLWVTLVIAVIVSAAQLVSTLAAWGY